MKATGEVRSVGRGFEESLLKGIRSLETGHIHLHAPKFDGRTQEELLEYMRDARDDRIFAIAQYFRNAWEGICKEELEQKAGVVQEKIKIEDCRFGKSPVLRNMEAQEGNKESLAGDMEWEVQTVCQRTGIDAFFIRAIRNIVRMEKRLRDHPGDLQVLREAKREGFSDYAVGMIWGMPEEEIFSVRQKNKITPVYKMIDTCASEFDSYVPYFYSTYEGENEAARTDQKEKKIIVLGSGPIRIGQGVEFDYSTVHAV